ncbi:MAG: FGGY-family carbohydrate kinase [Roseinatronobacter sp.]
MNDLALGIDLGTSGVRSAVIDPAGTVIAAARAHYGPGPDDYRDPERWWGAVRACLHAQMDQLTRQGAQPDAITRIGVDGTSGSVVLTDRALCPVTPALMYDEAGFTDAAARIAAVAPPAHVANSAASGLARALTLAALDRDGRAAHLLHQADFIAARLIGRGGMTDHNNALKTGLDPASGLWPDWIARLPLPAALLPVAHAPGTPLAPIAPQHAQAFGLSARVMIHAGTTDSIAAFLACAEQRPQAAVSSLGTTLAVKLFSLQRIDAPEMGLYAHRLGSGWLIGGASNTGGGVLKAHFSADALASLSARIDPATESPLDYYPLLKPGERFPVNDPQLAPRLEPRPADPVAFLHGLLEGIARIERRAYALMAEMGAGYPQQVLTAGGGALNPTWTAIRARVLGVPVSAAPTLEAAVGTARLVQSYRPR